MEIYEAIEARRTIREFKDLAVEMPVVEKIINAGLKAPSNDHLRNWEFVVVTSKEARANLLQVKDMESTSQINSLLDSWNLSDKLQRDMFLEAMPRQYSMLYNAGCLILPFFKKKTPLLQPQTLSSLNPFASIWCCIENMLLSAAAEGLFGVTRIPMPNESEHIKNVLKHPDEYAMPCYLALGYPAENAARTVQKNITAKDKIHLNTW